MNWLKRHWVKIVGVLACLVGLPIGISLSIGLKTREWRVSAPDEIHWHVAIGIWLLFILLGLFVMYVGAISKMQDKRRRRVSITLFIVTLLVGIIASFLASFRRGRNGPWVPPGSIKLGIQIPFDINGIVLFFTLLGALSICSLIFFIEIKKIASKSI